MGTQQFCLKWNNHQANMVTIFEQLLTTEALVDVTLACDGLSLRAHKMVLSACSPYFQSLFIENPCKHPIVIMKDMRYTELKAIIDFMYRGEVNVSHDQLNALLRTAETLKVKGLAEVCGERTNSGIVQQEVVQQNATSTPVVAATPHVQTRSDSPTLLSKRKRGRPRKRSLSDSNRSDDDQVPSKIKQPESPEVEELSADASLDASDVPQNIGGSNTQTHVPVSVHNSLRTSIQPSQEPQIEEPSECEFEVEPSKLMEQTLSTADVPVISKSATQITSSVHTSSSGPDVHNRSVVPSGDSQSLISASVSIASDSLGSSQMQGPDSPQDIKPALLTFEEPPISPVAGTSQENSSMLMYVDPSGVPAIPGTSYQQDSQGTITQDTQQGSVVKTERLHHFEECYEYFEFVRQPDTFTSMPSTIGNSVALTEKKCKCGYCKQSFWPEEIEEHICIKNCSVSVARIEYPHRCDACTKSFLSKDLLKGHTCTPVDSKKSTTAPSRAQYHCVTCKAGFRFKHQLKDHVCSHQKPKPFQCQICLKHYSTKQTLKHHLILHKDKKLQHLQCTWCQKKFRSKTAFETHIRTHTKCYECERCGKQFLRALDLRIHRIVHTHKKPFRCKLCNQGFIDRKYLNRHMQIHSDDQPHKCKICFKGFSSKFFVERHMITHAKCQAFKCKQCPKSFKDKHHLSRHLVVHTKEKKHCYAIYGKSFSQ